MRVTVMVASVEVAAVARQAVVVVVTLVNKNPHSIINYVEINIKIIKVGKSNY